MKKITCILFVFLLSIARLGFAELSGFYIGGGGGPVYLVNFTNTDKDTMFSLGGKAFMGYSLEGGLGLQLSYHNYGKTNFKFKNETGDYTYRTQAVALAITGDLFEDKTDIFGALGFAYVFTNNNGNQYLGWDNVTMRWSWNNNPEFYGAYLNLGVGRQVSEKVKLALDYTFISNNPRISGTTSSAFLAFNVYYYV